MKLIKKILIGFLLIVLIGVVIFGVREFVRYLDPTSIQYDGRIYTKSDRPVDSSDHAFIATLEDTGIVVEGMKVYDESDNPYASTVIYLKTRDGTFSAYELSGGP